MSRNNTGNPIGSKAFPDFEDNVPNLDVAVNSDQDTWRDRLGKSRLTWAGIERAGAGETSVAVDAAARAVAAAGQVEADAERIAQNAAGQAVAEVVGAVEGAVDEAQGYAEQAQAASEVALAAGWIYPTVAAGEAVRERYDYFWVVSSEDETVLDLYQMGVSVATATGKSTVSADAVNNLKAEIEAKAEAVVNSAYTGAWRRGVINQYGNVVGSPPGFRSEVLNLLPGTVVSLQTSAAYMFAVSASATKEVLFPTASWRESRDLDYVVPAGMAFVQVLFKRTDEGPITESEISNLNFAYESPVAYTADLNRYVSKSEISPTKEVEYSSEWEIGTVAADGSDASNPARLRSELLPVQPGMVLRLETSSQYMFAVNSAETRAVGMTAASFRADRYVEYTVPAGHRFARLLLRRSDNSPMALSDANALSVTYDSPVAYLVDLGGAASSNPTRLATYDLGWESGVVNLAGIGTVNHARIRSQVLHTQPGFRISLKTTPDYVLGINSGPTAAVPFQASMWRASRDFSYTIPEGHNFVRFLLKRTDEGVIAVAEGVNAEITYTSAPAYTGDLDRLASRESVSNLQDSAETRFVPTYRTPSQAAGGVISIIDDDGVTEMYTKLYPFFKARGIPFGAAIVPERVGLDGYVTPEQLRELSRDHRGFEVMDHTLSHYSLSFLTAEEVHEVCRESRKWFIENGYEVDGLVLPSGNDNEETLRIVSQYYHACYDFGGFQNGGLQSFDTIRNMKIYRFSFDTNLAQLKANVDLAAANGDWLVITTHVERYDWKPESWDNLAELMDYIAQTTCKVMLPSEAFHVFGNLLESDNGFRITAQGQIIPGG